MKEQAENPSYQSSSKLEICLANVAHNFNFFKRLVPQETQVMAMIKASAYGNGAIGLAKFIEEKKFASYLGVAYVEEGIELRRAGIRLPIMILNPNKENFHLMIKYCLEPEMHHLEHLNSFEKVLKTEGLESGSYPVHLKVNTGMNRLGFDIVDLPGLIYLLKEKKGWSVRSIMTHLSASSSIADEAYTLRQFQQFNQIWEELRAYLPADCWRHALNSNGIFRFPKFHYQMVRLGIGMYGDAAVPELRQKLKDIAVFKTQITQSRKVLSSETIGYSRAGRIEQDANIATIAVGYADGFSRSLGNGHWHVEINDKLYPTIGNVCMDMCMINLGNDEYKDGQEVILFGGKRSIHQYAEAMGTITYEAMCRVGTRVERVLV